MQQETIVKNADSNAGDKVAELRSFMAQQMIVLDKQIGSNVSQLLKDMDGMKRGISDSHGSSLVEINFRFAALKQEMTNMHEKSNKDVSQIHADFLKIKQFDEKIVQLAKFRDMDDEKFTVSDRVLEMRMKENYEKLIENIENTERRCKIDAQRVADLAAKKAKGGRGGSRSGGGQSSTSMISGSNPNLLGGMSSRKLIMSPSQASQPLNPQSPMSEDRKNKHLQTMEPVEEDRRDSRMSHDKNQASIL